MKGDHFIEYELNKNKDLKVKLGGMNLSDRFTFIWNAIRFGNAKFVLEKETIKRMNNVIDGKNPDGKELE